MTDSFHNSRLLNSLIKHLPNLLTVLAICAGLSAIRFGIAGDVVLAVKLVLLASVLDFLDGRIARKFKSESTLGAELDSLADFLNFGVAPPLILYYWGLLDFSAAGWIFVLFFAICAVMRLARFNKDNKSGDQTEDYFIGMPAPAAAFVLLVPIYFSFAVEGQRHVPDLLLCAFLVVVGLMMVMRFPTVSFKTKAITRDNSRVLIVRAIIGIAGLAFYPWETLIVTSSVYMFNIFLNIIRITREKFEAHDED